jgi:hypothetical protein
MTLLKNSLLENFIFGAFSKIMFVSKAKGRLKEKAKTLIDPSGHLRVKSRNGTFWLERVQKRWIVNLQVLFEGVSVWVARNAACVEWQEF